MAAPMAASMTLLNPKCCFIPNPKIPKPFKQFKSLPIPNGLTPTVSITAPAVAAAIFSTLSTSSPAIAAQQLAEIADGDNRGLALLLPLIPAILWVLYNILQPALNQLERMRSTKGLVIGLGLGGLAASSGFLHPPEASAGEIAVLAEAVNDNRGQLLLFVIAPAIVWVLYNILQPALNQLERMRSR
ncbi:photosystem II core complex proteins psbY, chloroplastic [Andrographis paniculata]|uniref:photosystem II core complex proteins psbY, chloroplastic n=1 Tax=Andrographis paniculata TaxID=175694 RepID=UPI0021E918D2|nr:photosystem II core complex proteins psbY, chloroplastic [Andrographis paniculata]